MLDSEANSFFEWFTSHGGTFDANAIGIENFPDTGRGTVALRDINEGDILFEIPRDLVLSTQTSALLGLLSDRDRNDLGSGWAGLILSMMWEEAKGIEGKWSTYFASMPTMFTTPMFWSEEELNELKGSTIIEKIGKMEADSDYENKVRPILQRRQDLFKPDDIETYYSIEKYHINGSRILSRSFQVEKWSGEHDEPEETDRMAIDEPPADAAYTPVDNEEAGQDSDEDDGSEEPAEVGMVPFADLLNARYGCNNARLFYEESSLNMIATERILKGSQIWNTYGDPPNSGLLRRYGHVDVVSTSEAMFNPADEVEIKADFAMEALGLADVQDRVDFFLEEGGDDIFVIEAAETEIPDDMISFIRLLLLTPADWQRSKEKEELLKPKRDLGTMTAVLTILQRRASQYPTSIQTDRDLLKQDISLNLRNAIIVRLGEKLILERAAEQVGSALRAMQKAPAGKEKKRKHNINDDESKGKRSRQKT